MLSESQQRDLQDSILDIARDLSLSLRSDNRYGRLLAAICRSVPCDAACLMRLENDVFTPLAARGLSKQALERTYHRRDHPRLSALVDALEPVRFPHDSHLPDPFDGLVAGAPDALTHVHDCMGCALVEKDEVVGVITLDAFEAGAFDRLDRKWLSTIAALAAATLRVIALVDALEEKAERKSGVAREIGRQATMPLVGGSEAMRRVRQEIELVAPSDLPLLIAGETGVGKEVVARLVHEQSRRAAEPLVQVNCAALPESVAESELFGHLPGAFTGAQRLRVGKVEAADGGTLFLDEVGELPFALQAKLLRVLQEGEVQRVGADHAHRVNVRFVAATNRDLAHEVQAGRFREDLFHRLTAFTLRLPPLRERTDDIVELAAHFAHKAQRRLGIGEVTLSAQVLRWLEQQAWPGNVRELENAVVRAALRASHRVAPGAPNKLQLTHFDAIESPALSPRAPAVALPALRERVRDFQEQAVREALQASGGSIAAAARALGMHRSNLHHLMVRLDMESPGERS